MHCSLFLQALLIETDTPSASVLIFEHGALGQNHQKDAYSNFTG